MRFRIRRSLRQIVFKLRLDGAQRFLESLIPEDTVALAAFTDQDYWLEDFTKDRKKLKKAGLLTRDPRAKERKKYGQKGARKRFQFSKR